uniref:Putative RNA-directed DNA polymerase n=1 Tax=Sipha flava TaxID=143950 RepID=A0A2S2Q892_9HEMI
MYKLKKFLPAPLFLLIKSYLSNRFFTVRLNNTYSIRYTIRAGVPQGSDIATFLNSIFTHDIPKTFYTSLGTYADDTLITASHESHVTASEMIQNHLNMISLWANRWKIKINETKSVQVTFSLRNLDSPPVTLNNITIPKANEVKYLGLTLDKRLTWSPHIKLKRKTVNSRLHILRPLLKSKLSLSNKLTIYKSIIRPAWTYGIQLWALQSPLTPTRFKLFNLSAYD